MLSREQVADIDRPNASKYEQNDRLLYILQQNSDMMHAEKLDGLVESLELTHQGHLASFFTGDIGNCEGSLCISLN